MLSAICFKLDQSKTLLSGNGLKDKLFIGRVEIISSFQSAFLLLGLKSLDCSIKGLIMEFNMLVSVILETNKTPSIKATFLHIKPVTKKKNE